MNCYFRVQGAGAPIVLTHGLAGSAGIWQPQVAALAQHYRVVTWDLRAHGRSPSGLKDGHDTAAFSLADVAADLRDVLDAAAIERAVVVGHSAGGVIAMRFALDFPSRTRGLVLVGTSSQCNERAADFYDALAQTAEREGIEAVRQQLGVAADSVDGVPVPAPDARGFAAMARCMGALYGEPLTPHLGAVHCPTLIIVGERDPLGVGGSVIISRHIAGAQLAIVKDRGHALFLEDPQGFNTLLADFLKGLD